MNWDGTQAKWAAMTQRLGSDLRQVAGVPGQEEDPPVTPPGDVPGDSQGDLPSPIPTLPMAG